MNTDFDARVPQCTGVHIASRLGSVAPGMDGGKGRADSLAMETGYSHELAVAVHAAVTGGAVIRAGASSSTITSSDKGDTSIVTQMDIASEEAILDVLREAFPDDAIYAEESGEAAGASGRLWVIDPLDGTTNFATGIPQYSVSIALVDRGTPVVGVVHHPISYGLTSAVAGRGARHDGRSIGPGASRRDRPIVAIDVPYGGRASATRARTALEAGSGRVFENWSPALDYVALATRRIDAIVCMGAESEDKIAGVLIALEAGCEAVLLDDRFEPKPWAWQPFARYMPWFAIATDRDTLDRVLAQLANAPR